ncbi:MAG: protein kinase [Planctomycetes bacterium]|nr:protein kinase [Planctomycetota bacterium]
MSPDSRPPAPTAERLFAEFLDLVEAGAPADFEAVCAAHPHLAQALRKVHERWQAMTAAFGTLSQDAAGSTAAAASSVVELKERLATPGGRLARYVLRGEIARGAMGRIVGAWDEDLRREVALKIHRGELGDARQQRRFLAEAQITAQLDHPGIVPIHELGVDADGRPFFAMQLVRGRDLGQILADVAAGGTDWTRTRVLHVLLRVCEAMAFAHSRGVVHRDLKPGNIMVGRFGETYVMDWGLAQVVDGASEGAVATLRDAIADEDADSPLLTRAGDVVGTPAYMAPEQAIVGAAATGPAVDVYAIGAVLWHVLVGAMPYASAARGADGVLQALRRGSPGPLPETVPPELRAICERAMARRPEDRYPGMIEFGDDLRAFLELRTVRAYATGRFAELRKWVARNRLLTATTGVSLAVLLVGAIAVTTLWVKAEDSRRRADASASRLQVELDRSTFQRARQAMRLDNSLQASAALWRAHLLGTMPRATTWALKELAQRDPYLVVQPMPDKVPLLWSRAGTTLFVGGVDGRLERRDPHTLALRGRVGVAGARLTALVRLPDDVVVGGTADGSLCRFTADEAVRTAPAHTGEVVALVAVRDGGLVSAGSDGRLLGWSEALQPTLLYTYDGPFTALASAPDGGFVVAATADGRAVGVAPDGTVRFAPMRLALSLANVAFGHDPDLPWVTDHSHRVRRLDLAGTDRKWLDWTRNGTGSALVVLRDGGALVGGWWRTDRWSADGSTRTPVALRPVQRLALSPDERWLATSSANGGLGIVDLEPVARRTIPGVGAVALSGDGRIAATSKGEFATVHDVATGARVVDLPHGSNGWLALDQHGRRVAVTKLQPPRLHVVEIASGRTLFAAAGPNEGSGFFARFSPDGDELAFASGRGLVRRVAAADGAPRADYDLGATTACAVAWSGDGRSLALVGNGPPLLAVFDVATGRRTDIDLTGAWPANVERELDSVALSHDGRTLAVGNASGRIRVRRPDGTFLDLAGHDGTVWSLQFAGTDDGLLFSSGGAQGCAAWDLDSGECCFQPRAEQMSQLHVDAAGETLACITPEGAVLLDLAYHDRHIAGNLRMHQELLSPEERVDAARTARLAAWAAEVLARPWPRWR